MQQCHLQIKSNLIVLFNQLEKVCILLSKLAFPNVKETTSTQSIQEYDTSLNRKCWISDHHDGLKKLLTNSQLRTWTFPDLVTKKLWSSAHKITVKSLLDLCSDYAQTTDSFFPQKRYLYWDESPDIYVNNTNYNQHNQWKVELKHNMHFKWSS